VSGRGRANATIRKPTLDEWFLAHQMRALGRDFFYNPGSLDLDITALCARWQARGERVPYTALVAKALALTARDVPELNRAYLRAPLGDRVVEFAHRSVNLPVALRDERGQVYLSAVVLRDADQRSVTELAAEIRQAQARPIDDTRVTRIVARRPNTLWWRTVLRGIHFAAYRWPGMGRLGAGGLSVSSLIDHADDPARMRAASFGPTAMTLCIMAVRHGDDGQKTLELGLGMNHVAMTGLTLRRMTTVLREYLSSNDPERLALFD
jgi:hypothetical protein